jgi:hypothetical protein
MLKWLRHRRAGAEFENDLAESLLAVEPSGRFSEPATCAYELAFAA